MKKWFAFSNLHEMRKGGWDTSTSYKTSNHEGRPRGTEQGCAENRMVEMSITDVAKPEPQLDEGRPSLHAHCLSPTKCKGDVLRCCCLPSCCQSFPFSLLEVWSLLEKSLATKLKDPFLYNKQMISRSHRTRLVELTFRNSNFELNMV